MNPVEWLKAIYETFGTPYPRASMALVVILGGVSFGLVWHFAAKQVEKSHQAISVPSKAGAPATGAASTTGSQSPAITGDGNQVTYGQTSAPSDKKDVPKK
jgi:hypothetical protein